VFATLLVLTAITVAVAELNFSETTTVVVAVTIATIKAGLVATFFMHLKSERPMVFWPLGLTAVLFAALFAFVLWTEADHLFGTRFLDAFGSAPKAPAAHGTGGGH
jgi:cytochrome c oxidase subunit 4